MLQITIDTREVLENISHLRAAFIGAVEAVVPSFGAFMPYSYYAEYGNGSFPPKPSVEPAILKNSQWITQEVTNRLLPLMDMNLRNKGSIAALRESVEQIWESVLNDKPRREAMAMARVRTGMHAESIRGYGNDKKVSNAIARGDSANAQYKQTMSRLRAAR